MLAFTYLNTALPLRKSIKIIIVLFHKLHNSQELELALTSADSVPSALELLQSGDMAALDGLLGRWEPGEIAALIEALPPLNARKSGL